MYHIEIKSASPGTSPSEEDIQTFVDLLSLDGGQFFEENGVWRFMTAGNSVLTVDLSHVMSESSFVRTFQATFVETGQKITFEWIKHETGVFRLTRNDGSGFQITMQTVFKTPMFSYLAKLADLRLISAWPEYTDEHLLIASGDNSAADFGKIIYGIRITGKLSPSPYYVCNIFQQKYPNQLVGDKQELILYMQPLHAGENILQLAGMGRKKGDIFFHEYHLCIYFHEMVPERIVLIRNGDGHTIEYRKTTRPVSWEPTMMLEVRKVVALNSNHFPYRIYMREVWEAMRTNPRSLLGLQDYDVLLEFLTLLSQQKGELGDDAMLSLPEISYFCISMIVRTKPSRAYPHRDRLFLMLQYKDAFLYSLDRAKRSNSAANQLYQQEMPDMVEEQFRSMVLADMSKLPRSKLEAWASKMKVQGLADLWDYMNDKSPDDIAVECGEGENQHNHFFGFLEQEFSNVGTNLATMG